MRNFYSFLQKKLGQVEEDLYIIVKEEKYKSFKFYFYDIFIYLALALQYLFFGFLEFLIKFFVLIFKTPKEAYEILVAPLEKLALEEERVKKQIRPFPEFVEYHKKARLLSNRVFGILVVAVVVVSVIVTLIFPVGVKVLGATYTFTQTNWSGGGTAGTAGHPTNSSGWTEYSSIGSGIVAVNNGADLELASTTASITKTSEADFSGGTLSNATTTSSGSVKLSKALHINEYTIGASTTVASITTSSVTANSNGTWTIAFSGTPNLARLFKNDKFTDSASKAWKVLSVASSVYKIIVVDSEGNTPTVSAPVTGAGTVGRWYASISAWETGREGDITAVGRNAIERGLPYYDGVADTATVTINGWATDATHYIEIYVPLSERHRGKWDDSKYRLIVSDGGRGIDNVEDYTRVEGLQVSGGGYGLFQNSAAGSMRASYNIVKGSTFGLFRIYIAYNNIVYSSTDSCFWFAGGSNIAYNNTAYNCGTGFYANSSGPILKNNISYNNTDNYGGGFAGTSANNLSGPSQTDAPGINPVNAAAVYFVDPSAGDFHLDFRDGTGNPAMNAGADLSADANLAFNTDIDGDARSGTWDIGADDVGATLVMTHSIGNSTRDFQNLGQWEDIRGGFLTTRQVFRATQQAAFTGWETVTGQTSGATGAYIKEETTPKSSLKGTYSNASGTSKGVFVSGNYAYVANDSMGLYIIDISNPASPSLTGSLNTDGTAEDVYVSGNYAYVSDGANGLRIINVSNPAAPTESGFYDTPGTAYEVQVVGNYAYVTDDTGGLQIINISNPTSPTLAGSYSTPNLRADDLYVVGSYAYITDTSSTSTDSGLRIINVSDPASPTESGFYDTPGAPWGLHVSGNYAYVADGPTSGLRIVNVSNPASPTLAGTYATYATDVYVSGNYAYIAGGNNGLQIINVSSSTTPTFSGTYNTLGTSYEVYVSGGYAYVADGSYELQIIKPLEYFTLDSVSGTFQVGETLVGATSGATSTIGAILTTQGTIEKGEAYNDSTFTAGVTIDGATTNASHYMWLTAEPGSRHTGVAGTGARIVAGTVIGLADNATIFENFEVDANIASQAGVNFSATGISNGIVRNNIIYRSAQTGGAGISVSYSQTQYIYNNIVYGFNDGVVGLSNSNVYNNVAYNNSSGIKNQSSSASLLTRNNISVSNTTDYDINSGSWNAASSNNISSDATAPGATGSQTSVATSSVRFVSTASDFIDLHILDGSVAKDAGADLSATFTGDIDGPYGPSTSSGQARPAGAAWDIGADEWFSSSPVYNTSGTFTSATIDFGNPVNFTTANFSRVLTSGGIGKAFGSNETGTLGNGTSTGPETCGSYSCSKTPVIISGLNNLVAVEGSNGWGNHDYHSVGLLADGTVKAWGNNVSGQLGDGTTATSTVPVTVSGISTAVAVAAGGQFSMALLANGTMKMWGDNGSGKLGDNTTIDRLTPVTVCNTGASAGTCDANPLSNVVAIAAGEGFAMALLADGTVKTWGSNWEGELGDGTRTDRNAPVSVSGITNAVAIGAGDRFAYAVLSDGTVKAWGQNDRAQLGINTTTGPDTCGSVACSTTPVLVCATSTTAGICDTYLSNVVSVAGGDSFALALLSDGTMKAWGLNCSTNGCLGDGTINNRSIPVTVCNTGASAGQCDANPLTNVVAIAAGEYFSLALISDGTVKAWGSDDYGQLGDNTTLADKYTPVSVFGISGATAIGVGIYHALIVTGGARFSAAAKTSDSGWQDSDYKPLGAQIGMSPTKAVFPTGFSGNRYLRYKAYLSTADSAFSPQMDDATVNYTYYATTSPALTSSPYNSNDATNILGKISWTATTTSGTEMRFQVRSSPDNITWSQWCGESACDDADYFAAADNNIDLTSGHPLKNGGNDKWLQYKAIFVSTGASTPTLGDVTLTYVVNAPPVLSTPAASQRTSDGKVVVDFTGYDVDTATGTAHPNQVSLTMEYWNGSTWVPASSVTGSTGWIAVSANSGSPTSYQFIWDAKTDFGGIATTTAKVRVTADDGEGANNTGVFQSAEFSLDTKNPVATLKVDGTYDGQSGAIAYVITDDNTVQCKGSNNSDYSADGLNANSGQWVTTTTSTTTWDFASSEPVKIYSQCKDAYQNAITLTSEAPITPANIVIRDSSDVAESQFREFVSWSVNAAGDFGSYKVYRSTDGSSYSLLLTITSAATNFISDGPGLSNGAMYYYKLIAQDSAGNISRYSSVVSDIPDGQGGTDVASPTITNVSISATSAAQATIIWTTDELSDSTVYYSTNLSYSNSKSVASMTTSHSVTLTGLTPNTTYNFRVRSIDPSGNSAQVDTSSSGSNIIIGDARVLPTADNGNGNLLIAQSTPLSQTATIQSLSFYVTVASGNLRLGIYDASGPGGGPGNKVAETAEITPTTGWNTANVVTPVSLSPGTYWLAYLPSSSSLAFLRTADTSSSANYYSYTYASLPGTFSTSPTPNSSHWSFYANLTIPSSGTNFQFTTAAGPVISSVSVSSVSGSSATIVWNTDVDSDSFVEFSINSNLSSSQSTGTTTFAGGSAPLYGHSVTLTGLTVDTKYYFKVKSTDSTPNLAQDDNGGAYYTFTTVRDVTAPVISSVSATLVDDDSAVITWVTNELADSRVQYGLSSDSLTSQTALDTTLTTSHSAGISSLIPLTQYYYRVVSKDADNNQSVSSVYNFTTTDQTYVTITTPPTYIRLSPPATVEPSASTVEEQISRTEEETITQTTQFKVDRESPTVINLQVSEITESSVRITWETDEPATSLVEYGETTVYGFTQGRYDFKTNHDVILKYLHEGTDYNYRIKSFDNVGNFTESANKVFKTLPAKESIEKKVARLTEVKSVEEINALTQEITDILATLSDKILPPLIVGERPDIDVSSSFAVIKWSTDRPSGSVVAYSEEKDYIPESYVSLAGDAEEQATTHSVLLANLKPGTTYHFQLRSKALVGGIGKSKDFTFTTKAEAGISDLLVSDITINSVTITWKTTVPATTRLEYGLTSDYANSKMDDAFNISHIARLTNLSPGTLYRYRVGGVGQDTKQFFSPNLTFVTEALPSLLNVNVESVEDREVSITWFTDVAADSTVVYTNLATGKTTTYGDKQFVKNHQVKLEGLEQGTEYKLQVVSKDEKGNEVKSSEYSFATSKDVQAPLIFNVQTQSAIFSRDKVQTIISWRTDEPATSQVTYQEGTAKDPKLEKQSKLNPDMSTAHTVVFTNFKPGAIYRFRLENVDQSGNVASSKDFSILTPQREETVFDLIIQNFRDIFRWTEGLQ